jgi:DNA-binding NarL/FixJ family response regulator
MQSSSPRILIVDSHPMIRDGLVALLVPALECPAITLSADFADAMRRIQQQAFELVISDFRILDLTVLDLLESLGKSNPKARCLVFTGEDEKQVGYSCMLAGATGFVSKAAPLERVVEAAAAVLNGRQYCSETLTRALMKQRVAAAKASPTPIPAGRRSLKQGKGPAG